MLRMPPSNSSYWRFHRALNRVWAHTAGIILFLVFYGALLQHLYERSQGQ